MPIRSCIRPIDELISNCGPPDKKNVRFADSATNQLETTPTHPRARRIKRSAPIPETPTPLTLISGNKKTVRFFFIERAILPNGQVSQSVISFIDSETNHCDEYWKPGALDYEPLYIMNCRTTRQNSKLLFIYVFIITFFKINYFLLHLNLHFIVPRLKKRSVATNKNGKT